MNSGYHHDIATFCLKTKQNPARREVASMEYQRASNSRQVRGRQRFTWRRSLGGRAGANV